MLVITQSYKKGSHPGIDVVSKISNQMLVVPSQMSFILVSSGWLTNGGISLILESVNIDSSDHTLLMLCHLQMINPLIYCKENKNLTQGTYLCKIGNTGCKDEHLHLQVSLIKDLATVDTAAPLNVIWPFLTNFCIDPQKSIVANNFLSQ